VDFEKLEKTLDWMVKMLKEQTATHGKDYWKTLLLNISEMWFDPAEFPEEKVKEIQTPSLILLGDRDEYIPISETSAMYKLMPNSVLAIIPNSNHDCFITQKEIFNQIVINYLLKQSD
ncbi:MAG: alpha/beta hydrolase, partial [Candidatus Heimdallarchaeota archaeon]|nr:alpha/beta hydrolase [Candidatus Heimdallarchaeota archaeon]